MALYNADEKTRLIGVVGPEHKPLHPPLFFFERDFFLGHGISWKYQPDPAVPTQTDTAQQAYWDVLALGFKVVRLPKGPKFYQGINWYDQLWIYDKLLCAHFWYGSRFQESNPSRTKKILDGITLEEHLKRKAEFMAEPLVKSILEEGGGNG